MSPPRDTAGSAAPQPQQPADAGRYNQKSTTFRNGTTEEGWFYPTPAALKAAADVRGARPRGNSSVYEGGIGATSPRAGNAEAYYPHFQFDSNYTYGMVHRERGA